MEDNNTDFVDVDVFEAKVTNKQKGKLEKKLIVLSHNAKRLHELVEHMIKTIEIISCHQKEMDHYTFVDTKKFIKNIKNIGDKFCIC